MENQRAVDQQPHPAIRLIASQPELFARQGAVVASWRRRGDKTYGPYYRLAYRQDGRQRSVYLGREKMGTGSELPFRNPANSRSGEVPVPIFSLVAQVRQMLADLREPLRRRRALSRFRRQVATALRVDEARLDAQLRPLGLRLKGFEVRGWRTSLLRPLMLPKRPAICGLAPIRRPQYKPQPFRPPRLPPYSSRRLPPAAIEQRLLKVIAARTDTS